MASTFLEWKRGSTLIFWRWHPSLHSIARDGFPPCFDLPLPSHRIPARKANSEAYPKILEKVIKFSQRCYLRVTSIDKIKSFIDNFAVKKGDSDIRVVFNGTSCGFNASIWAPNFWLPMSGSMVRVLGYNYAVVDIDLGEMFINFPLIYFFQQYSGVDLTPMIQDLVKKFQSSNPK